MRDEAKANEAKDKEERERVDKINAADSLIFSTEKQLKEYGDKIPADKKSAIETPHGRPLRRIFTTPATTVPPVAPTPAQARQARVPHRSRSSRKTTARTTWNSKR